MDKLVEAVSKAPKTRSKNDDDFADRLSSRYTVVLLIVFAVLVGIIEVSTYRAAASTRDLLLEYSKRFRFRLPILLPVVVSSHFRFLFSIHGFAHSTPL